MTATDQDAELIAAIREQVRWSIGKASYDAWIKRAEIRIEGDTLVVDCPNSFWARFVASEFMMKIERAAIEAGSDIARTEIIHTCRNPRPNLMDPPPKRPPPERPVDAPPEPSNKAVNIDDLTSYVGMEGIISIACCEFLVNREALLSGKRFAELVVVREAIVYVARKMTSASYPEIAKALRLKSHSTAVEAYQRMERRVRDDEQLPTVRHCRVPQPAGAMMEHLMRCVEGAGQCRYHPYRRS